MESFLLGIITLPLVIWLYLLLFRGNFWQANQRLDPKKQQLESYPSVCAIIPARNEAEVLPISLKSLLGQNYSGQFSIILIDDQSTDKTAKIAQEIALELNQTERLTIISGKQLPPGWTGKLWAMEQGIQVAQNQNLLPDYFLLTDADIEHDYRNLSQLIQKSEQENLALTSLMVLLRCQSFWERFLIPAFVFFFQKLYPFPWVNNPQNSMAAAAGGCILIRRQILEKIGGISSLRQALIDDCTLAQKVKSIQINDKPTNIWLGLTQSTHSLRPYDSLESIWNMVARTGFTQLNYSPLLLIGTLIGMTIIYLIAPLTFIVGLIFGKELIIILGLLPWLLMAIAYIPTLQLYKQSPLWGFSLPIIAFLYTLMTIDSAWRYYRGQGGGWKGRVYN